MKMEPQILNVMRRCKKELEDRALESRYPSRIEAMRRIIDKYRRTLSPHNPYPSMEAVCQIPDIRKAIVYGTDEEFSTCPKEVASGLPKLTFEIPVCHSQQER